MSVPVTPEPRHLREELLRLIADVQFEHRLVRGVGDVELDIREWDCSCGAAFRGRCSDEDLLFADHERSVLAEVLSGRVVWRDNPKALMAAIRDLAPLPVGDKRDEPERLKDRLDESLRAAGWVKRDNLTPAGLLIGDDEYVPEAVFQRHMPFATAPDDPPLTRLWRLVGE